MSDLAITILVVLVIAAVYFVVGYRLGAKEALEKEAHRRLREE